MTLLVGQETEGTSANGTHTNEKAFAYQYTAAATGTVDTVKVKLHNVAQAATSMMLAIMSDNGSNLPSAILQEKEVPGTPNSEGTVIESTGWSVAVTAGTKYWIVLLPVGGSLKTKQGSTTNRSASTGSVKKVSEASWAAAESKGPMYLAGTGTETATGSNVTMLL